MKNHKYDLFGGKNDLTSEKMNDTWFVNWVKFKIWPRVESKFPGNEIMIGWRMKKKARTVFTLTDV